MLSSFQSCLCGMLAELRAFRQDGYVTASSAGGKTGIEQVIDQIASRTIQLEVLDRKCINEARRHKSLGAKIPFRNKMLEHRRLQTQMAQLQRYRESALTHLDAVSNHEINQTFIRAIQGAGGGLKGIEIKEAESAIEDLQETVSHSEKLSELLGQPVGEEITDDDLDEEFLELSSAETVTVAPELPTSLPNIPAASVRVPVRPLELRVQEMFSMS